VSGQKVVILNLKWKNVNAGFKSIDLWVSMDDWVIMKAVAKTREDRTITMSFHDIDINAKITENEFLFNLPVDIQTIHDPLYSTGLNVKKR
jgi:outer membrane lipoprotein-sorting protein